MTLITVKTFDGHDLSAYRVGMILPQASAQNVFIAQALADSQDSGAYTVDVRTVTLLIKVLDYADRDDLDDQIKLWFKRGTRGDLVVTFADDGLDYKLPCSVVSVTRDKDFNQQWVVVMQCGASDWRADDYDSDTWSASGTSGSKSIDVAGKSDTVLSFTVTPSVDPSAGYRYQQLYQLVNVPGVDYGKRPWCLEANTLALVAQNAHKCQINQGGGIDASVTTIPYDTVTGTVPSAGTGYVGTEQISWAGRTGTSSGNLTGCVRGINGTTAATHADDAEIKVSALQADMNDYRIWIGDTEVKRWIDSPATTTTKIWFNVVLLPGYSLTLKTSLDNSTTPDKLYFVVDVTNKARIAAMPSTGIVYNGNEWFYYSGKDASACTLTLVTRGFMGTTKETHAAAQVFKFVSAPIIVNYGNASATSPSADDDNYDVDKPVFDLNQSDNTKWVYTTSSVFYDAANPNRPGSWAPFLTKLGTGSETETYYIKGNGDEPGDPAIGINVGTFQSGSIWKAEKVTGGYSFMSAGGIWKVSMTGRKYRTGTKWFAKAGLLKSLLGKTFVTGVLQTTPTALASYTDFTHSDTVITATTVTLLPKIFKYLWFGVFGGYTEKISASALIEGLTASIFFHASNLPTGAFLSATANTTLDTIITNTTTGDSLRIVTPMLSGKIFSVDGETREITMDGINSHGAITLDDDSRTEFIRLAPGNNDLTITSTDMGTLDIGLSWYARRP